MHSPSFYNESAFEHQDAEEAIAMCKEYIFF